MRPLASLLALTSLLVGCGSTPDYAGYGTTLDSAVASIDSGQDQGACNTLEALIASTNAEAKTYAHQRSVGAVLLAQLHERQSLSDAHFMKDRVGHLAASAFWFGLGQEWAAAAQSRWALGHVPEGYDAITTEKRLMFALLSVYGQLGLDAPIPSKVPDYIATQQACDAEMDALGIPLVSRPWIHYSLFRHFSVRSDKEPEAYRFGVQARELTRKDLGRFPNDRRLEVAAWILSEHRQHTWKCGSDGFTEFNDSIAESDPGTHVIDFTPSRK